MRIAYRVQHAAGRDAALARLLAGLTPVVPEVVTDHEVDDANPMRCFLRCLSDIPDGVTHLCVLQDDALPCTGYESLLQEAVGDRSEDVLSLFVGGLPNKTRKDFHQAMLRGDKWCPVYFRDIHHVVGTVWPTGLAREFVDWFAVTKVPGAQPPRSDDAVVGFWARTTHRTVWATVPCLVEHDDVFPTTIHRRDRPNDRGRRAIFFAG